MKSRTMFYFKACPKCQGDMYLDRDAYGEFRKCIQCGQMEDLKQEMAVVGKAKGRKLAA